MINSLLLYLPFRNVFFYFRGNVYGALNIFRLVGVLSSLVSPTSTSQPTEDFTIILPHFKSV